MNKQRRVEAMLEAKVMRGINNEIVTGNKR